MGTLGRSGASAQAIALAPLQRTLSCVSDATIIRSHGLADEPDSWTLSDRYVLLRGGVRLEFSLPQAFVLESASENTGGWRVSSRAYFYQVREPAGPEIFAVHWHPGPTGQPVFPHLHIDGRARTAMIVRGHHVPTGRVSLDSVVRFLIVELGVTPRHADWEAVLVDGERFFAEHRTW